MDNQNGRVMPPGMEEGIMQPMPGMGYPGMGCPGMPMPNMPGMMPMPGMAQPGMPGMMPMPIMDDMHDPEKQYCMYMYMAAMCKAEAYRHKMMHDSCHHDPCHNHPHPMPMPEPHPCK